MNDPVAAGPLRAAGYRPTDLGLQPELAFTVASSGAISISSPFGGKLVEGSAIEYVNALLATALDFASQPQFLLNGSCSAFKEWAAAAS